MVVSRDSHDDSSQVRTETRQKTPTVSVLGEIMCLEDFHAARYPVVGRMRSRAWLGDE